MCLSLVPSPESSGTPGKRLRGLWPGRPGQQDCSSLGLFVGPLQQPSVSSCTPVLTPSLQKGLLNSDPWVLAPGQVIRDKKG